MEEEEVASASICSTLTKFLKHEGVQGENDHDFTMKQLSDEAQSFQILSAAVENVAEMSSNIENTFISTLEQDQQELKAMFDTLDQVSNSVVPKLNDDLNQIEYLLDALEERAAAVSKEKASDWFSSLFVGSGSGGSSRSTESRLRHLQYHDEVENCDLHGASSLLAELKVQEVSTASDQQQHEQLKQAAEELNR